MHNDPRQALNNAQNLVEGKGFLGFLTKLFLGKSAAAQMSHGIGQAQVHLNGVDAAARLRTIGSPTQARVLDIADTGALVNFNPVVRLRLEVIPPMGGTNYVTEIQTAVSKIAVPRVGDILGVFVDPANPSALALAA
jgi:hypothetical protein